MKNLFPKDHPGIRAFLLAFGIFWTVVSLGFVFFRAETLAGGVRVLRAMLGLVPASAASTAARHAAPLAGGTRPVVDSRP